MTGPLALPDDVAAALLRPLTSTEADYVPDLIAKASALLRNERPSIDTRIQAFQADATDPVGVDPTVAATVVAEAVKRYMSNPQGLANESETEGPFSQSVSYALRSEKTVRGVLQITQDDLDILFPIRKRLQAGTIRVRPAMAPRPVGRYGPPPSADDVLGTELDYGRTVSEAQQDIASLETGLQ